MLTTTALISLLVLSELPVEVVRLDGQRLTGPLQSLSSEEVVIVADGESHAIPVRELQEVRRPPDAAVSPRVAAVRSAIGVTLWDGSLLLPRELAASQREVTLLSSQLGELRIPRESVANVRLSRSDQKLEAAWHALLKRDHRDDLVVVRKGDALDHVEGVVGTINAESVNLLLDGRTIPIPRNRVFGVIYATNGTVIQKPLCRFDLTDGQQLAVTAARFDGESFSVEMMFGSKLNLSADDVRSIDFSLGKIRPLADIDPTSVKYPEDHPLYLQDVWKYRRGRNSRGEPLLLGGRSYDEGLWIHSGTTLRYRLGREYRSLRGLMGIDEDIGDCSPRIGVIFRGDGRVLLEAALSRGDDVRELNLDIEGVRDLEIEVTSTDPHGICEHLDLVEARLIK